MKIIVNPDKEYVKKVRQKLKESNGYCPCCVRQNEDTKCICKEFRDMVTNGIEGSCHCGLYKSVND